MSTEAVISIVAAIVAGVVTIITALGKEIRASRRGSEVRHALVQDQLGAIESVASSTKRTVQLTLAEANARIVELEQQLVDRGGL